jgi:signal peptidase I
MADQEPLADANCPCDPRSAVLNPRPSSIRRLLEFFVLSVCFVLVLRQWGLEPFEVPTGSMAPLLLGHHRARDCPRCGYPVTVGRHPHDRGDGPAPFRCYRGCFCPNCGFAHLNLHEAPLASGDRILVSKVVYAVRRPRRWEVIVFRFRGILYIKRIGGLPGEWIAIRDGDVHADGELQRKTLAEFNALRIPVFDNDHQPAGNGWRCRWEAPEGQPHPLTGTELHLDGSAAPKQYRTVVYRHADLEEGQSGRSPTNMAITGRAAPTVDRAPSFTT